MKIVEILDHLFVQDMWGGGQVRERRVLLLHLQSLKKCLQIRKMEKKYWVKRKKYDFIFFSRAGF